MRYLFPGWNCLPSLFTSENCLGLWWLLWHRTWPEDPSPPLTCPCFTFSLWHFGQLLVPITGQPLVSVFEQHLFLNKMFCAASPLRRASQQLSILTYSIRSPIICWSEQLAGSFPWSPRLHSTLILCRCDPQNQLLGRPSLSFLSKILAFTSCSKSHSLILSFFLFFSWTLWNALYVTLT
jgi:hypothetical protein